MKKRKCGKGLYTNNFFAKFQANVSLFVCAMPGKRTYLKVTRSSINAIFAFLAVIRENKLHFWNTEIKLDKTVIILKEKDEFQGLNFLT